MARKFGVLIMLLCLVQQTSFAEIKTYRYLYSVNPLTGEKTAGKTFIKYFYFNADKSICYEVDANGVRKGDKLEDRGHVSNYMGNNYFTYQGSKNGMLIYYCRVIYEVSDMTMDRSYHAIYTVKKHEEWDNHVYFSLDYTRMNMHDRHTGNFGRENADTPINVYEEYTPDSSNGVQNHLW